MRMVFRIAREEDDRGVASQVMDRAKVDRILARLPRLSNHRGLADSAAFGCERDRVAMPVMSLRRSSKPDKVSSSDWVQPAERMPVTGDLQHIAVAQPSGVKVIT